MQSHEQATTASCALHRRHQARRRFCREAIGSRVNRAAVRVLRTYRTDGAASRGPKIAGRSSGRGTDIRALRGRTEARAGLIAEDLPFAVMVSPT
jgi:hypothetical protein